MNTDETRDKGVSAMKVVDDEQKANGKQPVFMGNVADEEGKIEVHLAKQDLGRA